jgi:ribosome-associated toxin RatA of RatAB toxin-antitoxin module
MSGMKELTGTATRVVAASTDDCFALLQAVDRYPVWHPDVVKEVDIVERGPDGPPTQIRTTLHVSRGPLVRDFHLLMAVAAEQPVAVTLTRLRNEPSDQEQFEVRWRLRQQGAATQVRLDIAANLSVPRLVPLGGVGDAMAEGFVAAAANALETP